MPNVSTPLDSGMDLSLTQENKQELDSSSFPYSTILGELMFLAGTIRPDISCSVREISRRVTSPCMRLSRGLQHVLHYLAGTLDVGINYKNSKDSDINTLVGYLDSDWGQDKESRRSITRYLSLIDRSPTAWNQNRRYQLQYQHRRQSGQHWCMVYARGFS